MWEVFGPFEGYPVATFRWQVSASIWSAVLTALSGRPFDYERAGQGWIA